MQRQGKVLQLVAVLVLAGLSMVPAAAQSIRRLYASQPPPGSTFVRIVNPAPQPVTVSVGTEAPLSISAGAEIATPYVVVPGGVPFSIRVDGREIKVSEIPAPETFVTVALARTPSGYAPHAIVDSADKSVGLNAELIFYDLVPDCAGSLAVTGGPVVFDGLAANGSRQRAINPVAASLTASCGTSASLPLTLPSLKAADYYSVFLVGEAAAPRLVGALDQTAPIAAPGP